MRREQRRRQQQRQDHRDGLGSLAPFLKINGIQVPVTLKMAEPEASQRARWLASEKRREMDHEMIGNYMFGKDHPRLGQPWTAGTDPFSTTAALMAKYGQCEEDAAAALLAAVEDRWGEFGFGEPEYPPSKRQKLAHTPVTPTVAPAIIPRAGCVVSYSRPFSRAAHDAGPRGPRSVVGTTGASQKASRNREETKSYPIYLSLYFCMTTFWTARRSPPVHVGGRVVALPAPEFAVPRGRKTCFLKAR